MGCNSCSMGLPCEGDATGGFLGFEGKNSDKARNTTGDILAGLTTVVDRADSRRGGGGEVTSDGGPSMVKIPLIGEVPVGTAVAGGAAAVLGLILVLR